MPDVASCIGARRLDLALAHLPRRVGWLDRTQLGQWCEAKARRQLRPVFVQEEALQDLLLLARRPMEGNLDTRVLRDDVVGRGLDVAELRDERRHGWIIDELAEHTRQLLERNL